MVTRETHENEDSISILLPALDHLVVLIVRGLGVYGEEWPGAVTEVGFSLRWLIWCWLAVEAVVCYRRGQGEDGTRELDDTPLTPPSMSSG
jgi:hypothetical protein